MDSWKWLLTTLRYLEGEAKKKKKEREKRLCLIIVLLNIIIATLNLKVCSYWRDKIRCPPSSIDEPGFPWAFIPSTKQGYCFSSGEDCPSVLILQHTHTHPHTLSSSPEEMTFSFCVKVFAQVDFLTREICIYPESILSSIIYYTSLHLW